MVFWMRRSARSHSGEIKEKVTSALGMGAGVLVVTYGLRDLREAPGRGQSDSARRAGHGAQAARSR